MDELNNRIFSIGEPVQASVEYSARIKALRRHLHDLYQKHRSLSGR